MRILMITWEYPPVFSGGAGTACHGMVRSLLVQGYHVDLFIPWLSPSVFNPDDPDDLKRFESAFTDSDRDQVSSGTFSGVYQALSTPIPDSRISRDTMRMLEGLNFDIIHCHDWLTLPYAEAIRRRFRKPLIFHVHSLESDRNPGAEDQRIIEIEKRGIQTADLVLAVSRYTEEKIRTLADPVKNDIRVFHNGYYLAEGGRIDTRFSFPADSKVVLFLGRLTRQKGADIFLEAALRLVNSRHDVVFMIAGTGPMDRTLRHRAYRNRNSEKILFSGFIPHDQVSGLLDAADILVIPSRSEPFGIVGLEGMSRGCTVIVTGSAGLNEEVRNVVALSRPEPADLESLIFYLLDKPEVLDETGKRAAMEAADFTWDRRIEELIGMYNNLLSNPRL